MKKLFFLAASAALVACSENPNQPNLLSPPAPKLTVLSPPGADLLVCWNGSARTAEDFAAVGKTYGGECTLSADHKKGVLDNNGSNTTNGEYSAVYAKFSANPYGEFLTNVTELSYSYKSLNVPALLPTPTELSFNIPIDTDNDGWTNDVAYVDAAYCGIKSSATVNIITAQSCTIYYAGTPYANWATFIAAPALQYAKISLLDLYIFVIAERTGDTPGPAGRVAKWEISNVKFGKTGLICFDGPREGSPQGGLCTLSKDYLKTATLDNVEGNPLGGYAGVFSRETTGYGLFLSSIKDLSFKYQGLLAAPAFGQLRYEIPISENNLTGATTFTAIVDVAWCPGKVGSNGVGTVNITRELACKVYDGSTWWDNWAAFAAAHPSARTATDHSSTTRANWITFISRRDTPPATRFIVSEIKWGAKL